MMMADYSMEKTNCKRCNTPDIEWDADDLANCICYDCLKSEIARLKEQYAEAMTALGFYSDKYHDNGSRARALIANHDKEKEGK